MSDTRLIQFQCQREGSLFYYQHQESSAWLVQRCPICGSARVKPTGRTYPPINEHDTVKSKKGNPLVV